jgi:endonuclease YncB( thermonuclease family)
MMRRREQNALYTLLTTKSWPRRIVALVVLLSAVAVFYTQQNTSSPQKHAEVIYGRIVGVTDGDTVTLLTPSNASLKIRFAFIDAPEKRQPYGQAAKKNLSDLIYNRPVEVHVKAIDHYGRTVGQVFSDGKDINLTQVAMGYAWHYTTYAKKMQSQALFATYAQAQLKAKQSRLGLWQEASPIPPWEFRRNTKNMPRGK